jgi:NRPS condensation-like uncharacterized protein
MIPSRFPATSQDQVHDLARLVADQQIQVVIAFSGRVDEERMARALRLMLDAEPVLGCHFVDHPWRPYWQRRNDLDRLALCPVMETADPGQDMLRFATHPTDPTARPQVQAHLFRNGMDALCIKVDHGAADATGAKEVAYLVADIYRQLGDDPAYRPVPNLDGSRSQHQVLRRFSLWDKYGAVRHASGMQQRWGFPSSGGKHTSGRTFAVRRLGAERLEALRAYAKQHQATVNDLLVTAFFRSLFEVVNPEPNLPLPVMVPIDLRRYLPSGRAGAICNLASAFFPAIVRIPGEPFERSLFRVRSAIDAQKASRSGLGGAISISLALRTGFAPMRLVAHRIRGNSVRHGRSDPVLSNFGLIDPECLNFGDVTVKDAYMLGPTLYAPGLMLAVSTFDSTMTFAVGFSSVATETRIVERFLDLFERELPTAALYP